MNWKWQSFPLFWKVFSLTFIWISLLKQTLLSRCHCNSYFIYCFGKFKKCTHIHTIMNGDEKSSLKSEITIRKMLVTTPKRWVRANCWIDHKLHIWKFQVKLNWRKKAASSHMYVLGEHNMFFNTHHFEEHQKLFWNPEFWQGNRETVE